jgi:hypothetical protein
MGIDLVTTETCCFLVQDSTASFLIIYPLNADLNLVLPSANCLGFMKNQMAQRSTMGQLVVEEVCEEELFVETTLEF